MSNSFDNPFIVLVVALVAQWIAAYAGDFFHKRAPLNADKREDFSVVRNAALTLLALIIGFSFSMAVSRYDQRKNYEEAEANAIGTEYARADLLPAEDGTKLRDLLRRYVNQRILFYHGDDSQISEAASEAQKLQAELWSRVVQAAAAQSTPVVALAVSGMNDVLNSQGYTQAAWWNRIPAAAWILMGLIAIVSNLLLGYRERSTGLLALMVVPMVSSIAFFLIADIDSPRGGVIRVIPHNLIAVSQLMNAHQSASP